MSEKREIRGYMGGISIENREDAPPMITGYAAVYNSDSVDLGYFTEVIRPGAFQRAISERQDVRALLDHDSGKIIARTKAGNLTLSEDNTGLRVQLAPIDTPDGKAAIEWVRSGVVDGFSFGFETISDRWSTRDGKNYRELLDVNLFEVSLVAFPAYPGTSVGIRSEDSEAVQRVWAHREAEIAKVEQMMASRRRRLRLASLG